MMGRAVTGRGVYSVLVVDEEVEVDVEPTQEPLQFPSQFSRLPWQYALSGCS